MLHGRTRPFARTRAVTAGDFTQGILPTGATLTRSSLGWYNNATPALTQAAINEPRFTYNAASQLQGLLVEPATTNTIRNPRSEGGTPGTPGTGPTFWSRGGDNVLTYSYVGATSQNGIPASDHSWVGNTLASGGQSFVIFEAGANPSVQADTWTVSANLAVVSGVIGPGMFIDLGWFELNAGFGVIGNPIGPEFGQSITSSLIGGRFSFTAANTQALTANAWPFIRFSYVIGVASMNLTLRIGAPQFEKVNVAGSAVLPPVAAPAATTRAADVLTIAKANGTYNVSIVRASGTTNLPGTVVSGGSYTVPTNVSPLRQVIFA